MTAAIYPKALEAFLGGSINLSSDTIKIVLVKNTYTYTSTHQYLSDLGAVTDGTAQTLASKTVTSGVFNAADVTFTAVAAGATDNALVIYKDTGVAATSPVIAYIDNYNGLPVTPNGNDIAVTFPNDANKIFTL